MENMNLNDFIAYVLKVAPNAVVSETVDGEIQISTGFKLGDNEVLEDIEEDS